MATVNIVPRMEGANILLLCWQESSRSPNIVYCYNVQGCYHESMSKAYYYQNTRPVSLKLGTPDHVMKAVNEYFDDWEGSAKPRLRMKLR